MTDKQMEEGIVGMQQVLDWIHNGHYYRGLPPRGSVTGTLLL